MQGVIIQTEKCDTKKSMERRMSTNVFESVGCDGSANLVNYMYLHVSLGVTFTLVKVHKCNKC